MKKININIIISLFIICTSHHVSYGSDNELENIDKILKAIKETELTDREYLLYLKNSDLQPLPQVKKITVSSKNCDEVISCPSNLKDIFPNLVELSFANVDSSYNPFTCDLRDPFRIFLGSFPQTLRILGFYNVSLFFLPTNLNEMCPELEEITISKSTFTINLKEKENLNICLNKLPFSLKKLMVGYSDLETLPVNLSTICPNLELLHISFNPNFKTILDSSVISSSIQEIEIKGMGPKPDFITSLENHLCNEGITPIIRGDGTIIESIYAPYFKVEGLTVYGKNFTSDEDFLKKLNIHDGDISFFESSDYLVNNGIDTDEDDIVLTKEQELNLSNIFKKNKQIVSNLRYSTTKRAPKN